MGLRARAKGIWMNMTGNMSGRYLELLQRDLRSLSDFEKNELEYLAERFKHLGRR